MIKTLCMIIFFLIDNRTILDKLFYFPYEYSEDDRRKFAEKKYLELENLIKIVTDKIQSKLVITNFPAWPLTLKKNRSGSGSTTWLKTSLR